MATHNEIDYGVPLEVETMRSHIGWRGERNIFYKGVETSP